MLAAELIRELGDLEFYLEGLSQVIRSDNTYFKTKSAKGVANLAEIAKKILATNKPVDVKLIGVELSL